MRGRMKLRGEVACAESSISAEERLRAIVETATDAIITIDERGIIESVNAATERVFGYPRRQLIGRPVHILMPAPHQQEHGDYLRRYVETGKANIIGVGRDVVAVRKDGRQIPIHLSISEVRLRRGLLFTAIIHDITERRRLERQVLEASADEQRRIGQELHDGVCQNLVGAALGLNALANRLATESPRAAADARTIADFVRETATQTRNLAHGLAPVDISAGGLSAALQKLATETTQVARIRCDLRCDADAGAYDAITATHLYRIVQEAVNNATRHGQATHVEVRLSRDAHRSVLTIRDNGRGFGSTRGQGIGLQTMAYRAHMIGGALSVEAASGGGTIVTCVFHANAAPDEQRRRDDGDGRRVRAARGKSHRARAADRRDAPVAPAPRVPAAPPEYQV